MSEKEKQTVESMAEAIKGMNDTQRAIALAYVDGMRAQKQLEKGDAGCRN